MIQILTLRQAEELCMDYEIPYEWSFVLYRAALNVQTHLFN